MTAVLATRLLSSLQAKATTPLSAWVLSQLADDPSPRSVTATTEIASALGSTPPCGSAQPQPRAPATGTIVVPSPPTLKLSKSASRYIEPPVSVPAVSPTAHTDTMAATISHDLAWTITKGNSATLVKRANGVQFSRDPLNLRNVYSRKNEGQIAEKVR